MERQWRCTKCNKLLGVRRGDRIHISFSRGHEYLAGLPVTATCRNCHTLNIFPDGSGAAPESRELVRASS